MTITCNQCGKKHTYEPLHKQTNYRRFCPSCANARKYEQVKFSNSGRLSTGKKPTGRPKLEMPEKLLESIQTWDEPNILGY